VHNLRRITSPLVLWIAFGCAGLLAGMLYAYSPETPVRVVGIGFDAQREREHFQLYAKKVATLRGATLPSALFEFVPVNLSDDAEVDRKIPAILNTSPNLIVAGNWGLTKAVQRHTQTVPVVFLAMAEPTDVGIVESEGRPRKNATGVTLSAPIVEAQVDWLLASVPRARRLLIISDKWWEENRARTDLLTHLATKPEITFEIRRVDSLQQAQSLMADIKPSNFDAWFFAGGFAAFIAENQWIEFVVKHRIPAAFTSERWGDLAGIISYQEDRSQLQDRMAEYIDGVLRGRDAREIAVDRPNRFSLTVNLKHARAIGLVVPDEVIMSADRVIR
jgi:putative tryptophan/tyrosine transport system substrate-binding protein